MTIRRSRPIVDQINDNLRQRIYDETYPPGSRLPSESELLQEFGVSRATVRTALTRLAAEGLIIRKQGDGTYVNEHLQDVNAQMGGLWEYVRLIQRSGYTPSIRLLAAVERTMTPAEQDALGAEPDELALVLKRLFLADDRPVITTANAIARRILHTAIDEINGSIPLPQLLRMHSNESIAYAIFDIRAALADEAIAALLHCEPGDPLLKIITTFYNADNQPLVYGTSYYDDAFLNLRLIQTWS
jgi:DNA-binding GntR family transcriptional regulator